MTDLSLGMLMLCAKWGQRPFLVRGEMEGGGGVAPGTIGMAGDWLTADQEAAARRGESRGCFTRVVSVERVQRDTWAARMMGVPGWFFDMMEAQDRRSNGGPALDS
jgi:hypothetical protein